MGFWPGPRFRRIFPISDVNENFTLEYVAASLGDPKYSVEECIERDMTYAAPLKATLRLVVWERPEEDGEGEKRPGDIIEKESTSAICPLLTELGTFIINGAERVVVSQLHRSPGVSSRRHPPERLEASQCPHHSLPGLVGRIQHRHQQHLLCAYRQEEEVPGNGPPEGLRLRNGCGHLSALLRDQDGQSDGRG